MSAPSQMPHYSPVHHKLPDLGIIFQKVMSAKEGFVKKILAPIFGFKQKLVETKQKILAPLLWTKQQLITPLVRPVIGIKQQKLGFVASMIQSKREFLRSLDRMIGGGRHAYPANSASWMRGK